MFRPIKRLSCIYLTLVFAMGLIFGLRGESFAVEAKKDAQTKPEVKRQVVTKEVVGEVAGISNGFIAVDYKLEEKIVYELAINMDKNTRFSRRALKEIKTGDIVAVTYEEVIETKQGQKPKMLKRLAKVVEFRQAARINSQVSGVLQSKEE